ncbi:MAG: 4Fe-4S binding protein [Chloroflexi bacterium]|nr:4Fe-4S binding protein [Chloroflexota bacterium]MCL5110220.1 4Fe-4S binding protein [Chloroflexota bacterium]
MKRLIVSIDEERCDGCGACVPNCVEGALRIVDGKARLTSDALCDGLGACLGECPRGALTVEERETVPFDEVAAKAHLAASARPAEPLAAVPAALTAHAGGCPGSRALTLERPAALASEEATSEPSELANWPVQLTLLPLRAPYLRGADLLICADCVPFAYPGFHQDLLRGRVVVVGCPKLDDVQFYVEKLATLLHDNEVKSITIAHMEVPCCFGLSRAVGEALRRAGKDLPVRDLTVTVQGQLVG